MDALLGKAFDDLQSEFAQLDAGPRQLGIGLDDADDVADCGIGVHAEQKIRGGKIEEAERMRLHNLRAVHDLAQQLRSPRNAHRHDGFAGLGRRQLMADGADAADARGNARHLVVGAAFGELLEAADLGHLKLGVGNMPGVVELNRDLAVALHASHRFNRNALHRHSYPNLILALASGFFPSSRLFNNPAMIRVGGGHPGRQTSTFTKSCAGRASFSSWGRPSVGMHRLSSAPST